MAFTFEKKGLEAYMTNPDAEIKGVWAEFPEGREFLMKRAGGANKEFLRAHQAALKPYKRRMDKGTMELDVLERIARQVYAKYVIADWKGIKDEDGKMIPFSPDACEAFFEAFPELFSDILTISTEATTFAQAEIVEAQETLGEG